MSRGASRTYIFENVAFDDGSMLSYREQANEMVADLLSTLHAVGGMVSIASRRVETRNNLGLVTGETVGLIVEWRQSAPLERLPKDEPPALEAEDPDDEDEWAEDAGLLSAEPDESELEGVTA